MSLFGIIAFSIGVSICVFGIISKIIEITAKKTVEEYLNKKDSIHKHAL